MRFADEAHQWGQRVIGASSLDSDPYASRYDVWEKLPFINDAQFFPALKDLVKRQHVDLIFTPHAPSFNLLEAKLHFQIPHVAIRGEGPYKTQVKQMELALDQAERDLAVIAAFGLEGSSLPVECVAGIMLQMDRLYGQCAREKALAVCAIMPSAAVGDVVEIGSLFGKSTYVFNRLASYCQIGGTLAVDLWSSGKISPIRCAAQHPRRAKEMELGDCPPRFSCQHDGMFVPAVQLHQVHVACGLRAIFRQSTNHDP